MSHGQALVKSIASGDTLMLEGQPKGGPPPVLKLSLASIQAPKLAVKTAALNQEDEPYAWECREALRELVIGKSVQFKVDYSVGERQYGTVTIGKVNVAVHLLEQGFAKVISGKSQSPHFEDLQKAEEEAKAKTLGIHGGNHGGGVPRTILGPGIDGDFSAQDFLVTHKHKKVTCIVEWVRDAGFCKILVLPKEGDTNFYSVPLNFAGLTVEGFKRDPETRQEVADGATSHVAKHFVERRVLHRKLDVRFEGMDTFGNFQGTLYHPKAVISKLLVEEGFARVGGAFLSATEFASELRELQKAAQEDKKGRWKNYAAPEMGGPQEFTGKLIEVVSGDCLVVKDDGAGDERRVYLSSVKAPKIGRRDTRDEPCAFEAREFLRKKFIGKKVKVCIEYSREPMGPGGVPLDPPMPTMYFAAIFERQFNLAVELLNKGLALYQRHRTDDDTSAHLEDLMAAEKKAEELRLGQFANSPPPTRRFNDLVGAENSSKAKAMGQSLQRMGKVQGVVEFVFNAGRFKVRIDRENLFIPLVLTGIKVPQTARPDRRKAADPFGDEAHAFARETVGSMDVTAEVHTSDRGGNALGSLWIQEDGQPKLFAEMLLERGFAQTLDYSLQQMPYATQLLKAEEKAKQAEIGLWSLPQEDLASAADASGKVYPSVYIVHINTIMEFFIQEASDPAVARLEQTIAGLVHGSSVPNRPSEVKRGMLVLAEFQGGWYRAQVQSVAQTSAELLFVDFGNVEAAKKDQLRVCPGTLSLQAEPARAVRCSLSGLLEARDFEPNAARCMNSFAEHKWTATVESVYQGTNAIVLSREKGKTVNEEVVGHGLARVDPRTRSSIRVKLEDQQKIARRSRVNMWQYGDNFADDDDYS